MVFWLGCHRASVGPRVYTVSEVGGKAVVGLSRVVTLPEDSTTTSAFVTVSPQGSLVSRLVQASRGPGRGLRQSFVTGVVGLPYKAPLQTCRTTTPSPSTSSPTDLVDYVHSIHSSCHRHSISVHRHPTVTKVRPRRELLPKFPFLT